MKPPWGRNKQKRDPRGVTTDLLDVLINYFIRHGGAGGGDFLPKMSFFSPNKYCSQRFGLIKLLVDMTRWVL